MRLALIIFSGLLFLFSFSPLKLFRVILAYFHYFSCDLYHIKAFFGLTGCNLIYIIQFESVYN